MPQLPPVRPITLDEIKAARERIAPTILRTPLFLALAPVMLLVGLGLGWTMMRQIRFWRDQETGKVWMAGGIAYALPVSIVDILEGKSALDEHGNPKHVLLVRTD